MNYFSSMIFFFLYDTHHVTNTSNSKHAKVSKGVEIPLEGEREENCYRDQDSQDGGVADPGIGPED